MIAGIDVSHHQEDVAWQQVKTAGIEFAFTKATQGKSYVDPKFQENWKEIKNAGIIRGAYHFFQPGHAGKSQAENFLKQCKPATSDLPPVLDVETAGEMTRTAISEEVQDWLDKVEKETGSKPIVYSSNYFWNHYLTDEFGTYPLWIAHYGVKTPKIPDCWNSWSFWQYSQSGTVAGVQGAVDLNYFNGTLQNLKKIILK